jgi:hypothetical protein
MEKYEQKVKYLWNILLKNEGNREALKDLIDGIFDMEADRGMESACFVELKDYLHRYFVKELFEKTTITLNKDEKTLLQSVLLKTQEDLSMEESMEFGVVITTILSKMGGE